MCTVSMVAQDWTDRFNLNPIVTYTTAGEVSRQEFDALKKELEALKNLLIAAKEYDTATGQPDCESAEKTALFRRLADLCGVDLSEVFPK